MKWRQSSARTAGAMQRSERQAHSTGCGGSLARRHSSCGWCSASCAAPRWATSHLAAMSAATAVNPSRILLEDIRPSTAPARAMPSLPPDSPTRHTRHETNPLPVRNPLAVGETHSRETTHSRKGHPLAAKRTRSPTGEPTPVREPSRREVTHPSRGEPTPVGETHSP